MQKLQSDQIAYLKSGNQDALTTVRYIVSQIRNKEIEKKAPLTDEEIMLVLRKQLKEIKESIDAFEKGGRAELLEKSKKQYELVSAYLPPEATDEELEKEILAIKKEQEAKGLPNPKALIGICVGRLKSKAEPGRIIKILNKLSG